MRTKKIIIPKKEQIMLNPEKTIMSKTNAKGIIEYANDYFMEICGYKEPELIGKPHNVVRHPDMPKIIFKLMWDRLKKGKNIHALVKNLAKDGRYYWVLTNFETKYDEQGEITAHYARRKMAPAKAILKIENIYKTLSLIEMKGGPKKGLEMSEKYFIGYLEDKKMTYDELILSILETNPKQLKKYFSLGSEKKKKKFSLF